MVILLLSHCIDQMQALQNMYEYLLDAESQMGTDKASNNEIQYTVEGGQAVPVAAGAGDTNICGGIIQLYWDNILGRCLDTNEQVRQTALKVMTGTFEFVPGYFFAVRQCKAVARGQYYVYLFLIFLFKTWK